MLFLSSGNSIAQSRIALTYLWRHGRLARLQAPQTFTELVQWRKLYDRNPLLPLLADKVAVKTQVAGMLGPSWITPTLWNGLSLPDTAPWSAPYVVKARHGCQQTLFVTSASVDFGQVQRISNAWLHKRYGYWLDEWLYGEIPRGILVEPYIGAERTLPIDYKIFVFGGRAEFVQVHLGRGERHRWIVLDRNWRRVSSRTSDDDPKPPQSLRLMLDAAETLACDLDFVRVDLYDTDAGPRFGEMTFYPGSGLHPINPPTLDAIMGAMWRRAQSKTHMPRPELTGAVTLSPAMR